MRRALLLSLLSLGCSTIGDPGGAPDGLPHGGTGAFRLLDAEEVGIVGSLPGRAMVLRDAVEGAMPAGGFLFYATAPLLDEPPMLPADHPPSDIYWPAFEPRRIHRGASREEGFGAFDAGDEVLTATERWEGAEVYDPWVTIDADGTARLYYAAEQGIGVAEARSVDGVFTRVSPGPIVTDATAGSPRHPSVVRGPDEAWWMYYDAGDEIRAARSTDGRSFTPLGPITLSGDDEGDGVERSFRHAGAVRIETRADRVLIRLYVESVREGVIEGQLAHTIRLIASEDGLAFTRYPQPLMEQTDVRYPAPLQVDDRVTLLYANLPFSGGPFLTRAVVVAVGPSGQRFAPEL